jgi:hypothetical protein
VKKGTLHLLFKKNCDLQNITQVAGVKEQTLFPSITICDHRSSQQPHKTCITNIVQERTRRLVKHEKKGREQGGTCQKAESLALGKIFFFLFLQARIAMLNPQRLERKEKGR